jgi:hypothetical protein
VSMRDCSFTASISASVIGSKRWSSCAEEAMIAVGGGGQI